MSGPTTAATGELPSRRAGALRALRFVLIQVAVVAGLLALLEGGLQLAGVEKLSGKHEKPPSTYPQDPDRFLKIAIFGGSSAAATYSARGFDDLIRADLTARFPDQPLYLKNYAQHGEPFHRHQAEYAKRLVSKYDYLLIYCGNNEAENWYDDSGYWRKDQFRDARDLQYRPPPDAMRWSALHAARGWLREHSRLYALVGQRRRGPAVSKNRVRNYQRFEAEPSIPVEQLDAIDANFQRDLEELATLAEQHDAQILVATTATYETWPPAYSMFADSTTDPQRQAWLQHFERGEEDANQGAWAEAEEAWGSAAAIDDTVAILAHRRGQAALALGNEDVGRQRLQAAMDADGHYFRPRASFHEVAERVASQYSRLHEVDVVAAYHQAYRQGVADEQLFTDVCHPNFTGYVIIADAFLQQLCPMLPGGQAFDVPPSALLSRSAELYRSLQVRAAEEKVALAGNVLYCFDLMHFNADVQNCRRHIEKLLRRMEESDAGDPMVQSFSAVCRARFAVQAMQVDEAARELNVALRASPVELDKILDLQAWDHIIEDEFTDVGIYYSRELKAFRVSGSGELPSQSKHP